MAENVETYTNGQYAPYRWDGNETSAGVYFINMETEGFQANEKITLIR